MASIKKNFLYNSILTTANYIFPILVFPYVSRVLGVTNIGICNFVDSIIQNFILISMLGIPIAAIREVVAAKRDRIKLNKVFSGIFYFNAILTAIAVLILLVCTYTVPDLYQYKRLMFVGIFKLVANFLMIEWFFKGIENFKYITIRSVAVKILYVIAIFLFVKTEDDYVIYFVLTCSIFVVNAVTNLLYSRKFVSFTSHPISLKVFFKPIMVLGIYMIFTSFYTSFNTSWLGIATDATQVGYFTTSTKLYTIILAVFTAFTSVMLPRMTDIINGGDMVRFRELLNKSSRLFFSALFPIVFYGLVYADQIVLLIAGEGFEGAALPMRICMCIMLVVGYEQVLIIQGLMPLKKDKTILLNSIIGGVVALICCMTLTPWLKAVGAALVWLCSEVAVAISASIFMNKYIGFKFPFRQFATRLLYNLPLGALLVGTFLLVRPGEENSGLLVSLFAGGILMAVYTVVLQCMILKEEVFIQLLAKLHLINKSV